MVSIRCARTLLFLPALQAFLTVVVVSQESDPFADLRYRTLGAYRAGAWVGDVAVPENRDEAHRHTFYVAPRCGGVWKTVNAGTTFEPIFDTYGTSAIGAVEVAPSDANVVWVGTGDDSLARSSYAGNGVWKSIDAGKTFTCMGLEDTHHVPKIVIHPNDANVVYVAAMGHLFSENEERGVFRTRDGGTTWERVLYASEAVGVVDLVIDPRRPNTLFAATYEKVRLPWHYEAGGEGSAIWRTRDGGDSWERLSGGLPTGTLGRIGIDIHRGNTNILYAIVENLAKKPGAKPDAGMTFDEFADQLHANCIGGEVYRTDDGGDHWTKVSPDGLDLSGKAAYSFNEISVDPANPDNVYLTGVSMQYSFDGGKTWPQGRARERFRSNFGDVRTFWIDPNDPEHMLLGSDGGIYASYDGGRHMMHFSQLPLGEIYAVEVDRQQPYNVYIGLQDHEVWRGPSNSWSGSVGLEEWVIVGMWDGMYTKIDWEQYRWAYFTTQFGKHHRVDMTRGERVEITPRAAEGQPPYRYTWTTPLALSPHNASIVYTGGQMLLRSLDRGETWEERSPDLTTNDAAKIAGEGHIMFCTITTIGESPRRAGVLWCGTDDGRVWVTRDHGASWFECTGSLEQAGAPRETWVSRVVPSHHEEGTAYVTKSGYREDVFEPFVYVTRDFGRTWKSLGQGLPHVPVSVIVEDRRNENLLFVGHDLGVHVSLDGGTTWLPFQLGMPNVPVRDLLIHPREQDLVVGTYGRGAWITNVSLLQELTGEARAKSFHLGRLLDRPVAQRSQRSSWGNYHMMGDNHLRTPNEHDGLRIPYYLGADRERGLTLRIEDGEGRELETRTLARRQGAHVTYWKPRDEEPGTFRVILSDGEREEVQRGRLTPRLTYPLIGR